MTSLAKQLQKLAIPGQPSLRQVASKKRPSLLFDAKEAADIDISTIHCLGVNGLEELISIDSSFSDFEVSLFNESCKDFERTVQTKDYVEVVDQRIGAFLRKLSPYFLLKPAQKCLEWLIRAFRINSFNINAIMECILPYYETKLFARMLQLLPLKDPTSMWHWLRPVQKVGSPLAKQTLIQHCISVRSFLVFVSEMVPLSLKEMSTSTEPRVLVAFYSSTVIGVLESVDVVTEEMVACLLPYIVKGLKSSSVEYGTASLMIVCQLASVAILELQLCLSLIEVIAKNLSVKLLLEGITCMCVICQTQKVQYFSDKALKYLRKCSPLVSGLSNLTHSHSIAPFLSVLLGSLLSHHFNRLHEASSAAALDLMLSLLDEVSLGGDIAYQFTRKLIECFVSGSDATSEEDDDERLQTTIGQLAQSLDTKYPSIVDKALEDAISSAIRSDETDSESKLKHLHQFISLALPQSSRHQVLLDVNSTLALSVHHPNPSMRSAAVKQLAHSLQHNTQQNTDDFVASSLLNRLSDDDPTVISAVLDIDPKVLFRHLPSSKLVASLIKLLSGRTLNRSSNLAWQTCALKALKVLMSQSLVEYAKEKANDVIIVSLPLLYVGRHGNTFSGSVGQVIAESYLGRTHPFLKHFSEIVRSEVWLAGCDERNSKTPGCLAAANDEVFSVTGRKWAHLGADLLKEMLSKLLSVLSTTSATEPAYYVLLAVAGNVVISMPPENLSLKLWLALKLLSHLHSCNVHTKVESIVIPTSLSPVFLPLISRHPNKPQSHALLVLWLLNGMVEHLGVPTKLSTALWLEVPSDYSDEEEQLYYLVLLGLFSRLTHYVDTDTEEGGVVGGVCKYILSRMIQLHLSMCGFLLRFLAMIWTAPLDLEANSECSFLRITPVLQARSLNIATAYLRSRDAESVICLLGSQCPIVPSLLIPLMSPHKFIRDCVLSCLTAFNDVTSNLEPSSQQESEINSPFIYLVHSLCSSQVELSSDPSCLQQVLKKALKLDGEVLETPRRNLRKRKRRTATTTELVEGAGSGSGDTRAKTLDYILLHIAAMGAPPYIQCGLLKALIDVDEKLKFTTILPMVDFFLNKPLTLRSHQPNRQPEAMDTSTLHSSSPPLSSSQERWRAYDSQILSLVIKSFTTKMAPLVQVDSVFLQSFVRLLDTRDIYDGCSSVSPLVLALRQLTTEFFSGLNSIEVQQSLLGKLVDLLVECKEANIVNLVKDQLVQLDLSSELVVNELTRHIDQLGGDKPDRTPSKKPRYRDPLLPVVSKDDSLPWKRVMVVLEALHERKHSISDRHLLMPCLFQLLNRCLEVVDSLRLQLEYTQQLILSSLLHCCEYLTDQGIDEARELLPESQFNVELVVQCVRLSTSPQTHRHALLLLSTAAPVYPSRVLHNVMPIFTFMGTHVLGQDDQYSSQVISRIINNIIPALIKSESSVLSGWTSTSSVSKKTPSRNQRAPPTSIEDVVREIIHVFVDALPHVPDHRRLALFCHLLETVHPEDYLHVAMGLLIEKAVVLKEKDGDVDNLFPLSLAQKFPPQVQLLATLRLINYLSILPEERPTTVSKLRKLPAAITALFHVGGHTAKQLKQFKHSIITFLVSLVSQESFTPKVSVLTGQDATAMEDTTLKIVQSALKYVSSLNESKTAAPMEDRKFWQVMVNKTYQFVGKVVSLLAPSSFLSVITQLVTSGTSGENDNGNIQRKGLDILKSKLAEKKTMFTELHDSALLKMVHILMGVAGEASCPPANRQSALVGVKLLTQKMGSRHTVEFVEVAREIVSLLSTVEEPHPRVLTGCLLCVAELCPSLGAHAIPLLPSLMPHLLTCIGQEKHLSVQVNAVSALGAIVQTLPKFLSSYLYDIIAKLCSLCVVDTSEGNKETEKLLKTAREVREKMAISVPSRSLLPAYNKCYADVLSCGKASVAALLSMLTLTVSELGKEDVRNFDGVLLQLFLTALDYRASTEMNDPLSVEELETQCIEAFTTLVMKLSEARFGPMFLKLLDWASHPSAPKERLITFYHLADCVAGKLKSLFLLFAGHIIKSAATLLEKNHIKKQESPFFASDDETMDDLGNPRKSCLLLSYILQCLQKVFLYDKNTFLTKERFETLLQPLIDQVTNNIGGPDHYHQRVESTLAPCLAYFAVAAGKESLWKPLNYQLLLKTRHSDKQVRFAVLKVLREVYSKLGEEFMILLPETIPFLAELMEDDCEEVEQQTQAVIRTIEDVIGESIQQHF